MARRHCRHGLPVTLLALVLLGNARVEGDSELIPDRHISGLYACSPKACPVPPATPTNLTVNVSCANQANITWKYKKDPANFLVSICSGTESICYNQTIPGSARNYSLTLPERDTRYKLYLRAHVEAPKNNDSKPATAQFSSYPEVHDVKNLTLTTLNYSAILVKWEKEGAYEIEFKVCNNAKTRDHCKESTVQGTLLQHIFCDLSPDTVYTIFARNQVTLNNKTCQGPLQNRTAQTFPKPPGPVSNLNFNIVDSVFLNATWEAPADIAGKYAYTIDCRDKEGQYDVAEDVFPKASSANVTLALRKFGSSFNCSVWAFIDSNITGRVNGKKTFFEVATQNLDPPKDLNVVVQCKNQADITWGYKFGVPITGFVANLCRMNGSVCENRILPAPVREVSYQLQEYDDLYNISVVAYVNDSLQTVYSWYTTAKFFSFPTIPDMKSLTLAPLNYSAVQATWKVMWSHEIRFVVCRVLAPCDELIVPGSLLEYTFNDLKPNSAYVFAAQAQVTLNNKTCAGDPQYGLVQTLPKPPGPVSNLTYEIVNNIFLNAKWGAPHDNVTVDGFTIKCGDTDGSYNVTRDVIPKETSAHVTLPLRKFASTFNCSVWAFLIYNLNERVNGRKTVFEVTTPNLEPPENVTVVLQCQNNAKVTWNYKPGVKLTGFVVELCWMNKSLCTNKTLPGAAREVEYSLLEYNALYTISVLAYVNDSIQTIYSSPTTATFFSFPKLPVLDDLSVSALNTTALSATWKEKWAYEIEFHLCTTPYDCQTYLVPGTLLQHTFSGLQPNTQYNVSAQAEFILYNRTCKGTQQSRTACTLAQAPGMVEEVKYQIKKGIFLVASWKSPKEAKFVAGYTISCLDSKTEKNVTTDVETMDPSVNVTLNLHEPVGEFDCSVWAYNEDKAGHRVPGPKFTFEVTTYGIVPPRDVKLVERTGTSLTYTWTADPTAPGWNMTIVAEGEPTYSEIAGYGESDSVSVTHNITSLAPWTTYNVSIVNCRPTYCSEPTFVQSTTAVAAPSRVRDLRYHIVDDIKVLLSWKKPGHPNGPIDGYSVFVFNEDQQDGTVYDVKGRFEETTIDLKYQFNIFNISIEAYNVDKWSNASIGGPKSEVQFETFGEGPMPPRPKFGAVTDDGVHLSWKMPEDPRFNITCFNVSISHRLPFLTKERSFNITNLEPWMDYNVNISSCTNSTECGQWQNWHFKTDVGEPSQPLDLEVGSASTDWLLVEWKKPKVHNGPLSGYNVTFKKGEGEVHDTTTTQLSYNITGLAAGTTYEVSVYAFNDGREHTKRGPAATLKASTVSETTSMTTTLLAIFIPVIILGFAAAGFFIYKRYQKRNGGHQPLVSREGWDSAE
ncbi:fibronectin-like [Haemaphysalis longicornis]